MFFKKKKEKDEFDFDDKLGDPLSDNSNDKNEGLTNNDADLGLSSAVKDSSSNNSFDSLHQSGMHDNSSNNINQNNQGSITNNSNNEFQIMNAKLDSIKSELDALRQHVLKIEEVINKSKKKPMW